MDTSGLPFLFTLFLKYFWLLAILLTFLNAWIIKNRTKIYIERDPSLEAGYDKLIRGFIFWENLPWAAMGIGMIFGEFNTVFDIVFGLRSGNPFVWLFFGTVVALWILLFLWVFFWGGAETLSMHPGFLSHLRRTPAFIKFQVAFILAGSVFVLFTLWTMKWQ